MASAAGMAKIRQLLAEGRGNRQPSQSGYFQASPGEYRAWQDARQRNVNIGPNRTQYSGYASVFPWTRGMPKGMSQEQAAAIGRGGWAPGDIPGSGSAEYNPYDVSRAKNQAIAEGYGNYQAWQQAGSPQLDYQQYLQHNQYPGQGYKQEQMDWRQQWSGAPYQSPAERSAYGSMPNDPLYSQPNSQVNQLVYPGIKTPPAGPPVRQTPGTSMNPPPPTPHNFTPSPTAPSSRDALAQALAARGNWSG